MKIVRRSRGMRLFLGRVFPSSKYYMLSNCTTVVIVLIQRKSPLSLYIQPLELFFYTYVSILLYTPAIEVNAA